MLPTAPTTAPAGPWSTAPGPALRDLDASAPAQPQELTGQAGVLAEG